MLFGAELGKELGYGAPGGDLLALRHRAPDGDDAELLDVKLVGGAELFQRTGEGDALGTFGIHV